MQSGVQHSQLGDVDSQNTLYPIYSPRQPGGENKCLFIKTGKLHPKRRHAVLTETPHASDCVLHVVGAELFSMNLKKTNYIPSLRSIWANAAFSGN